MKRTGLCFYVEGEYVTGGDWEGRDDPGDENWIPFDNADIHPLGSRFFTAWSQFSDLTDEEMTNIIVTVIDWLYQERNWRGFCATLWLCHGEGQKPEKVFGWELC